MDLEIEAPGALGHAAGGDLEARQLQGEEYPTPAARAIPDPVDHIPASMRDSDCLRYAEKVERQKSLFRQARGVATALRTITDRQRGQLTRADGHVASLMVLQNLRACVRGELFYRPTRRGLAKETGYSERTISASLTRLRKAGIGVVARYGKGGRLGHKGKGLSTEWRSGCLQFLCDQLAALGYRLPKGLRDDLNDWGAWAARQVGQQPEHTDQAEPTGKQLPGTLVPLARAAPGNHRAEPVEAKDRKPQPAPHAPGPLARSAMPGAQAATQHNESPPRQAERERKAKPTGRNAGIFVDRATSDLLLVNSPDLWYAAGMISEGYSRHRATAERLAARYGGPAELKQPAPPPSNPWDDPEGDDVITAVQFVSRGVQVEHADGPHLIQTGERHGLLFIADPEIEPVPGDRVTLDGRTYDLMTAQRIAPDPLGKVIGWSVMLRR